MPTWLIVLLLLALLNALPLYCALILGARLNECLDRP